MNIRPLVVGAFVVGAGLARADILRATLEQPMFEVSHTVDVRIEDGVAVYKVKRQFANPGKVADEARLEIDLPTGAAATGLRIRAKDRWYDGELMEREKAAKLYQELTGFGAAQPKDPALLAWMWADKLSLQVFPVMPGQVSTVEYTLTVPTRYAAGRYWVSYPRTAAATTDATDRGLPLATPILTVHPGWGNAMTMITVDGKRAAPDTAVVLTPPVRQPWEDAVDASVAASYVASTIEVAPSKRSSEVFSTAKVVLKIAHTYKSDVKVELLAPTGDHVTLFDRKGGGDNNIVGTFPVTFPKPIKGAGTWRLVVSDHVGLDNGSLDSWSLQLGADTVAATDVPVFIPDAPENGNDAGLAAIAVAPPKIEMWNARLGKVVASDKHAFGRLEVDTAPQLVPLPKRAQLVFVLDASYSVTEPMIDTQLAILRTYASHVPDADVQVVLYRREAKAVFTSFVSAAPATLRTQLDDARKAGKLALGNGSALDAGLMLAAKELAKRTGPRRIIVMTDHLLRSSLAEPKVAAVLDSIPSDIVVHVIRPHLDDDDRVTLAREDQNPLATIATKHHGIYTELAGMPTTIEKLAPTEKLLVPVILELVRPTRVEKLVVDGGFTLAETTLHEGEGLRLFAKGKTAPNRVTLSGVLWSDPVKKQVFVGDAFSRSTAAFVFGEDEYHDLSEAEQLKVAFMGRAVSPVTSYVAYEPGTRPSTIGLGRYGTLGHGSGSGSGYGAGTGALRKVPNLASMIDTKACVAQHKPAAGWKVQLSVETTRDEIVDVAVTGGAGPLATCLLESTWQVRLDSRWNLDRESFVVDLGP